MVKLTDKRIIGLIGMSGAGKSTVCKRFCDSGFDVIDCDKVAREVVQPGANGLLDELAAEFSADIIAADGSLDRKLTAQIIFNSAEKRMEYNRIIYPYITYRVFERIKNSSGDILLDAPTLFDARLEGVCDTIVSVCADREICINRIMTRDNIDRTAASARLTSQHDIQWYKDRSEYCIINNSGIDELLLSADEIISKLKGI